jgi:hypothetical protein
VHASLSATLDRDIGGSDLLLRGRQMGITHRASMLAAGWLLLGAILIAPVSARAQTTADVLAANTLCATTTATAISLQWAEQQVLAAEDAVARYAAGLRSAAERGVAGADPTAVPQAEALLDAAKANSSAGMAAFKDAKATADNACMKARAAIQSSHLEIRDLPTGAFVGMSYCDPITVFDGDQKTGGIWIYGYPFDLNITHGVAENLRPVTIVASDCRKSAVDLPPTVTLTPPPPDATPPPGGCSTGTFWSRSGIIGCMPCRTLAQSTFAGDICFIPPTTVSITTTPPPPPPPSKKPPPANPCQPGTPSSGGPKMAALPNGPVKLKQRPPQPPQANPCKPSPVSAVPPQSPPQSPGSTGVMNSGKCSTAGGHTTCTDTAGHSCTTTSDFCDPAAPQPPPGNSGPLTLKPGGTQVASADSQSVPACESKPPFLPWGGKGSARITVSGGKPCGIGWHDTGATILDSMTVTSQPGHGSLTPKDQHVIVFTPTPGYKGQDSFTVSMREHNRGRTATLSVKVSITVK